MPRTELHIPAFYCLDQSSHYMRFSCSMLQMQDGIKAFQISHHITPSTVLIPFFLPFMCSNLDLHVHRFYINCLITCLFSPVRSQRREDKAGKEGKGGITVKVNSFPRIH